MLGAGAAVDRRRDRGARDAPERAGSLDAIERGKRELVEALPRRRHRRAQRGRRARRRDAASTPRRDVLATASSGRSRRQRPRTVESLGGDGMRFRLRCLTGRGVEVTIPALGRHSVHNALAAAAVGFAAGSPPTRSCAGSRDRIPGAASHARSSRRAVAHPGRQLQRGARLDGRRARAAGHAARPPRGGPGRDARAGRRTDEAHRGVGAVPRTLADRLVVVGARRAGYARGAARGGHAGRRIECAPDRDAAAGAARRHILRPTATRPAQGVARRPRLVVLVDALVRAGGARRTVGR